MSTAADRLRAQGKKVAAKPSTRSEEGIEHRKTARPTTRTEPIGKTVKLPPALNSSITEWQGHAANQLGLSRVTFQQLVQALCEETLANDSLGDKIRARINQTRL